MNQYLERASLGKWDARFLSLAEHVAAWSKGPRKRIGAVIVRPDRSVASVGYNGPPRDFDDAAFLAMSRDEQHKVVVHAEINAIEQLSPPERTHLQYWPHSDYTLYVSPLYPCASCAEAICAYPGIRRIVANCGHSSPDWLASAEVAAEVFKAHGVECVYVRRSALFEPL